MIGDFIRRVRRELALRRLAREIDRARLRLGLMPLHREQRKSLLRSIVDARSIR